MSLRKQKLHLEFIVFFNRIIKEQGFTKIENYIYEDHEMLQRASAQTINNLLFSEEVVTFYEGKNDRVKYLVLLSTSEDIELSKAASGSLAILTSVSKRASRKVFEVFLSTRQIFHFSFLKKSRFIGNRMERNLVLLA